MKFSYGTGNDITQWLQESLAVYDIVEIPAGSYEVSNTIFLKDGNKIFGSTDQRTELRLAKHTNTNMFSNVDPVKGNKDIAIYNLFIDGNGSNQFRPDNCKKLSFCNILYFSNVENCVFEKIKGINSHQTVLHFNNCNNILINDLYADQLGWSGISTSGTNNLTAKNVTILNSGLDHRHSAIHLDGGVSTKIDATIINCVGNGVMLDAQFSDFGYSVIEAECYNCMRGISVIGSHEKVPHNIFIKNSKVVNNEIGIMISNAENCIISECQITNNREVGVLFQGRFGGCKNIVDSVFFSGNTKDFSEKHSSRENYIFN